jgi:hypothetical protein
MRVRAFFILITFLDDTYYLEEMLKLLDFDSQKRNHSLLVELFNALVLRSKLLQSRSTTQNLTYERLSDENSLLTK